jgi:hypothetical protein
VKRSCLYACVLCWLLFALSATCGPGRTAGAAQASYFNKHYFMLLIAFPYPWPEFVDLQLADNGSFSLKSDFFREPARGTYQKNAALLKGTGQSVRFFDTDYDVVISLAYDFVGMPLGFRNFFMLGTGMRTIRFYSDNNTISENFIFQGPGFNLLTPGR